MKLQRREYVRTPEQLDQFLIEYGTDITRRVELGMTSLQQLHQYIRNQGGFITEHYLIKALFKLGYTTEPHPECSTCGDKLISPRK